MKVQTRANGYVLEAPAETAQQLIDEGLFIKADDDAPLGLPVPEAEVPKPKRRKTR